MARVEVYEITNISQQLVTFGYSSIDPRLGIGVVDPRAEGILKLVFGSSTTIEAQRVERGELESLQNLGQISFQARFVNRPDIPRPSCFEIEDRTFFVGYAFQIQPRNLDGPVEYWSVQGLPSGWSFNAQTGVITVPAQAVGGDYPIVVSTVSPDNLVCAVNYTVRVEQPDVIDFTWDGAAQPILRVPVNRPSFTNDDYRTESVVYEGVATLVNCWVDWGDGSPLEYFNDPFDSRWDHTYLVPGSYNVRIEGELDVFSGAAYFNDTLDFFYFLSCTSINEINSESLRVFNVGILGVFAIPPSMRFPNLEDASFLFSGNTGAGATVMNPAYYVDGVNNVTKASSTFQQTGLTGPVDPAWWSIFPNAVYMDGYLAAQLAVTGPVDNTTLAQVPATCIDLTSQFQAWNALTAVSNGVLDPVPQLRYAASLYTGTTSITSLPANFFNPGVNTALEVFSFGALGGYTGTIPPNILQHATGLRSVPRLFASSSVMTGTIPAGLFNDNPLLEDIFRAFRDCQSLTGPLPATLFASTPNLRSMDEAFYDLRGLVYTIPVGFLDGLSNLESAVEAFRQQGLGGTGGGTGIPAGLLDDCTSLRIVDGMFSNEYMTSAPPSNLFANCPLESADRVLQFYNLVGPNLVGDLFGPQPSLLNLERALGRGTGSTITNVGAGLFTGHTAVQNMRSIFSFNSFGATITIPLGSFDDLISVNDYTDIWAFLDFGALTIDDFLISVDTNNVATGARLMDYSSSAGTGHLDINRSPAAAAAKANLITNGWVITGVY